MSTWLFRHCRGSISTDLVERGDECCFYRKGQSNTEMFGAFCNGCDFCRELSFMEEDISWATRSVVQNKRVERSAVGKVTFVLWNSLHFCYRSIHKSLRWWMTAAALSTQTTRIVSYILFHQSVSFSIYHKIQRQTQISVNKSPLSNWIRIKWIVACFYRLTLDNSSRLKRTWR